MIKTSINNPDYNTILSRTCFLSLITIIFFTSTNINYAQYKRQNFEVAPFVGYFFSGNLQTIDGELRIENNLNYGLAFDIRTSDDLFIEILYNRTDTEVRYKQEYYDSVKTLFNMSIEYFQAGAHIETQTGQFRPFAAFTVGTTYFNPKDDNVTSDWIFSFTAGGGIKYYFTNSIGLRLQWRFLVPIYFSGGAIFCGNEGCGIFVSGGTYMLQYDLTAGLAVSF